MTDKKALALLRKYYLPYKAEEKPSAAEIEAGIAAGVLVPASEITHDEMVREIKRLAERIPQAAAAKAFLYSLSSGDMRYRTALSSLVWARSLPGHSSAYAGRRSGEEMMDMRFGTAASNRAWTKAMSADAGRRFASCAICGCSHGMDGKETVDWNEYGVFRYLPPTQYGREPDYICAEYVLNDLREFERLPAVEPCEEDYRILNELFAAAGLMKPHNMDTALVAEIRRRRLIDATGNGVHCLLAALSICGILESGEFKGFLHGFTNSGDYVAYRDNLCFFPLFYWRGKDGVNYRAVEELFGSFSGGRLAPEKAVFSKTPEEKSPAAKTVSKAEQYYRDGEKCVTLTNEERRYLALDELRPEWEAECYFSVTHWLKKHTTLFYEGDTIVKVIHEETSFDDGRVWGRSYCEYDTRLSTEARKLLLPLTARGRAKPITPSNVMAVLPFGCRVDIILEENESKIWARNPRNHQDIPIGEEKRIQSILSDQDFHAFMRYYISTCPDDYFARISEVRSMEHQTVRFSPGDIFRCQTDRTHYTYGIILGKTRALEKWKELPAEHSFRHLMTQPILVRMYDLVTTDRDMTAERLSSVPLRPPEIYSDADIVWGTHQIVAHKELTPEDIQFPLHAAKRTVRIGNSSPLASEQLSKVFGKYLPEGSSSTVALYVEWGFVSFDIRWENVPAGVRQMLEKSSYSRDGVWLNISGAYCGRTLADILRETPGNIIRYDLLLPENRDKFILLMNCLGLPEDCPYDTFAERFGGISRQRYIELLKERRG